MCDKEKIHVEYVQK